MKLAASLVAVVVLACLWTAAARATVPDLQAQADGSAIEDKYIVVLEGESVIATVAGEHADLPGLRISHVYDDALDGYAASIPDELVEVIRADERVALVEQDRVISVAGSRQSLPWGIGRIDADVSSTRAGNGSGAVSGVNAYVIDSGIASHGDLNVVSPAAFNAVGDGKNYDCLGHGTHVAGTIAARDNRKAVVGDAPGTPLTGVKVFDCDGYGTTSGVIAGVDWVTANARKPAVANMSLGGGASLALDLAVENSVRSGVFYAVSAGNKATDACTTSPARAGKGDGIMTVGAINRDNTEAYFSNYGACVDVWAPGSGILSTRMGGGTTKMSGTSMAAPHVAGAAALYLSGHPEASPATVEARLEADAIATGTQSKDGRAIERLNARGY
jgi:subtilisin family serine protease